jgi:hypothetical protein
MSDIFLCQMYIYMHIQIVWSSDIKLRYLCFILLCIKLYLCYFGWEMHLMCFDGMRERYVSGIVYSKCFDLFDIYIYICIYININKIEVNALEVNMKNTFTRFTSRNKGDEV